MNENPNNQSIDMEDISSTSASFRAKKNPIEAYANGMYESLSSIIKIIAFVLAFAIIILSFVLAFILFSKTLFSIALSLAVIIFGTVFAAILFFPIYGIGQILSQNNEILKKLDR